MIRFGKQGERLIPVKLGARLTEIGTLETWCDSKISDNRWRLQFDLRKSASTGTSSSTSRRAATVVSEEAVAKSVAMIDQLFSPSAKAPFAPEELPAKLEQTIGLGRNSWPLDAIRKFADTFVANTEGRKKSPAYEFRWLNLCGFCMRPGFGFPGDDFRVEQLRRIYHSGLQYANQTQNEIEWWIFWGRIAGGLNRNQQSEIYQRLAPFLLPRGNKKPPRVNSSLLREMWRAACSLELLPGATRTELGDALIRAGKAGNFRDTDLWCLTRLGSRELFYGPINQALPPAVATRWVEALIKVPNADDALASLARRTGDPTRDVAAPAFQAVAARLTDPKLQAILEGDEQRDEQTMGRIFGEALPSGLVLAPAEIPS